MPATPVRFGGENSTSGTHAAGNKIYWRSTSASDDGAWVIHGDSATDVIQTSFLSAPTNSGKVCQITDVTYNTFARMRFGTAAVGLISIYSNNGTAATGYVHVHALPSNNDTLSVYITGGTAFTATFKTTLTPANNEIKIQGTAADQAEAIASWITDSVQGSMVDGTDWVGTGTAPANANIYVTATVSGDVITFTSKIKSAETEAWIVTASNTASLTVYPMAGGVDGTLIGQIAIGTQTLAPSSGGVTLNAGDQTTKTLPYVLTGTSESIRTRGKFGVNIRVGAVPNAQIAAAIQVSDDGTNWFALPTTTIADLDSDQDQRLNGDDLFAEYARLNITDNIATVSTAASIYFIHS